MPFVTESFKISLIIPVQEKDSQKVKITLTIYELIHHVSVSDDDFTEKFRQELHREER